MDKTHRYNSIISAYTAMRTKASLVTKSNNAHYIASEKWSKWNLFLMKGDSKYALEYNYHCRSICCDTCSHYHSSRLLY